MSAPFVVTLLGDRNEYVRSRAIRAISSAVETDRATLAFRQKVFDPLARLAFRLATSGADDAPRCLLALDKEAAIRVLCHPQRMRGDQENLHNVLRALREADVTIAEDTLLRIISVVENETSRSAHRSHGEALMMLAASGAAAADVTIRSAIEHPEQRVREYAAKALLLAQGLENPVDKVWDKYRDEGWQNLSIAQRHVLAVRILTDEVKNGGFLQYFVNSSGDNWPDAEKGLVAIGANNDLQIFREALARFSAGEPSVDRRLRHKQTAEIAKQSDRPFEALEKQFFKDSDAREVLLMKYITKHAEYFGKNVE